MTKRHKRKVPVTVLVNGVPEFQYWPEGEPHPTHIAAAPPMFGPRSGPSAPPQTAKPKGKTDASSK